MPKPTDTSFWDHNRNLIRSRKGGWIVGQGVYCHGYSMMEDLLGKVSLMRVMVLNATGRLPGKRLGAWLEASFLCASWPDARIWCNQIGAFAGTLRTSPVAATMAGTLAADSMAYGPPTMVRSMQFIQQALQQKADGIPVSEIVAEAFKSKLGRGYIVGYSRPVASGDLRIPAMERTRKRLGFPMQAHLKLAFQIGKYLHEQHSEQINAAGYLSAFLADQGFSPVEVGRIYATLVSSGVLACYADARDRPAEAFLPLRCTDIHYLGKAQRQYPEAV
ncbi:hypothetical protein [Candidatus Magnetaquicoccus inordinatus]|uniref:hypothetical protein n=1 Tax=Candidatus Magnetaquicoccus inordinatus TaxID=2496818 RepID=UPI00102B9E3A|nr:hypothetical protein [Candidatus Magnetaquicoccus inordinatus]